MKFTIFQCWVIYLCQKVAIFPKLSYKTKLEIWLKRCDAWYITTLWYISADKWLFFFLLIHIGPMSTSSQKPQNVKVDVTTKTLNIKLNCDFANFYSRNCKYVIFLILQQKVFISSQKHDFDKFDNLTKKKEITVLWQIFILKKCNFKRILCVGITGCKIADESCNFRFYE